MGNTMYRAFAIDLDGVFWRGSQKLPGADEFLAYLHELRIPYRFLSNNSMISAEDTAEKLRTFGFSTTNEHVVTAGSAAVTYIARKFPQGKVWVTGLPTLRRLAASHGLHTLNLERNDAPDHPEFPAESADVVLVGLDRTVTYAGLQQANCALRAGAAFIAVNKDPVIPMEHGLDPGCGAILAALETASGKKAEIIGKPAPRLLLESIQQMNATPANTLMIGDALDMDIAAGVAAGTDTLLLLSGVSTMLDVAKSPYQPTYIRQNLQDALPLLKNAQ